MADIQLRFNKDMLVLSTPIESQLRRVGMDFSRDNELALLIEPEVLHEAYALEVAVGAQCIVADTANLTPARLAHSRCKATAQTLAQAALAVVNELNPQHVLAEIAPCGLPLDPYSADSLNENRDQYVRAAKAFDGMESQFDAYFLNGFTDTSDLKCALMGLRKVTDKPIFASVDLAPTCVHGHGTCAGSIGQGAGSARVGAEAGSDGFGDVEAGTVVAAGKGLPLGNETYSLGGKGRQTMREAAAVMAEYGAQVAGFSIYADAETAALQAEAIKETCMLPILVQLGVDDPSFEMRIEAQEDEPDFENPFASLDAQAKEVPVTGGAAPGTQGVQSVANGVQSGTRDMQSDVRGASLGAQGVQGATQGDQPLAQGAQAATRGAYSLAQGAQGVSQSLPSADGQDSLGSRCYTSADDMVDAAELLGERGVQFLRAVGNATPAYTGALVAATAGHDVALDSIQPEVSFEQRQDLDELANTLRARLDAALNKN